MASIAVLLVSFPSKPGKQCSLRKRIAPTWLYWAFCSAFGLGGSLGDHERQETLFAALLWLCGCSCAWFTRKLGPPVVPTSTPFFGEGSPTEIDYRTKGYSNLSTGGPSKHAWGMRWDCHGPQERGYQCEEVDGPFGEMVRASWVLSVGDKEANHVWVPYFERHPNIRLEKHVWWEDNVRG